MRRQVFGLKYSLIPSALNPKIKEEIIIKRTVIVINAEFPLSFPKEMFPN